MVAFAHSLVWLFVSELLVPQTLRTLRVLGYVERCRLSDQVSCPRRSGKSPSTTIPGSRRVLLQSLGLYLRGDVGPMPAGVELATQLDPVSSDV